MTQRLYKTNGSYTECTQLELNFGLPPTVWNLAARVCCDCLKRYPEKGYLRMTADGDCACGYCMGYGEEWPNANDD